MSNFAAPGTLHCKISMLSCILGASIVLSQGFCVSKLEFEPLHSRLHLRQVGVIDRKEFALQVSIQNFLVQRNRTWMTKISQGFARTKGPIPAKAQDSQESRWINCTIPAHLRPLLVSSSICACLGLKFR